MFPAKRSAFGIIFLLCLGMCLCPWQPARASGPTPTPLEIAQGMQKAYNSTKSMRAEFRQVTSLPMSRRQREGSGRVIFQKPGKMRWDYLKPDKQVLVSDGDKVYLYFAKEAQMIVRPVDEYLRSDVTYAFFSGSGDISRDFEVKPAPREARAGEYVIQLVPRETHPQIDSLYVWVDRKSFFIRQLEIIDQFGSITRLYFSHIEKNPPLSPKLFLFTPPPGTEIIEQ